MVQTSPELGQNLPPSSRLKIAIPLGAVLVLGIWLYLYLSADSRKFTQAQEKDTVAAYERYLAEYPQGKFASQAEERLDSLKFTQAKAYYTIAAYEKYLKESPNGKFVQQAQDAVKFKKAESVNTPEAYEKYLKESPSGRFVQQAQDTIKFKKAESANTTEAYLAYLQESPQGKFTEPVRLLIALTINPDDAVLRHFVHRYSGPIQDKARDLLVAMLESQENANPHSPSPATLQRLFKAAKNGEITLAVQGTQSVAEVISHVTKQLQAFGFKVRQEDIDKAAVRVRVSLDYDKGFVYSKFGSFGGGPCAEIISARLEVFVPQDDQPELLHEIWSNTLDARSPESVSYTYTKYGYSGIDPGPTQADVHKATTPVFHGAFQKAFQYSFSTSQKTIDAYLKEYPTATLIAKAQEFFKLQGKEK